MSTNAKPNKSDTRKSLELAIKRIQEGVPKVVPVGHKLSIAAVAKEAGVSNATIHNRYPDIAERIRTLVSGSYVAQLEAKRGSLKECQGKLAQARNEIEQLTADLRKSQSINLRLLKQNELLRAQSAKHSAVLPTGES